MAQGDYLIQNQSFPSFRSDLNDTLEAINTSNSGTSRPTSAVAGTVWLDVTNATNPTLKFFDGTDDISLATLDYTANTVNWLDSTVSADVVGDTTPQLGGNLDVNGNSIVSVSNGNITFTPDGTGKVIIDGLSYPSSDGTSGQFLKTDGSGNLSFDTVTTAGTTLTTQGDMLYRDGSGLQRLAKGTAGQTLIMNSGATAPEWGSGGGDMTPSFFAYRDDTLTLASNTETTIGFNLEQFDTDSAYDTSTYKFTVPSGKGGKYFLFCHLRKQNFSGNRFYWQLNRDISGGSTGNAIITAENTHSGDSYVSNFAQTIFQLGAGDSLYIRAYHNDSGTRELISDISACYFGGYRLAD